MNKTNLHDLFYYDGVNLRNKISRARALKGKIAGGKHNNGYWRVRVNKKELSVHRVIWEMYNGTIPENMQIDHINHIRDDNRLENLRLVTRQGNGRNQSLPSRNTSGVVGVSFRKDRNKWESRIRVNGKYLHLGCYDEFENAVKARKEAEEKYNFHENHGKPNK